MQRAFCNGRSPKGQAKQLQIRVVVFKGPDFEKHGKLQDRKGLHNRPALQEEKASVSPFKITDQSLS